MADVGGDAKDVADALTALPPQRATVAFDDERSSLITPYTILPGLLARSTAGQVAWNVLLFVALPVTVFGYWIYDNAMNGTPADYSALRAALPLAAVWVVSSPLIMFFGERAGARWVASLSADAEFGWNIQRVREAKHRIDRLYYPTALLGGAAAVVALGFSLPTVHKVIPAPAGWGYAIQFIVFAQAGFTAMSGLSGVLRWIVVTRAAVSDTQLRWHPYRTPTHGSLGHSYRLSLMFGIMFSTGALFVPTLLAVVGDLTLVAAIIIWAFIVLLLIGGVLIFVVPVITLASALARGKRAFLGRVTSPLADLVDEMICTTTDRHRFTELATTWEQVLKLHGRAAEVRLLPIGQTVGRAFLTVVVPVVSLGLSILQSGLITT